MYRLIKPIFWTFLFLVMMLIIDQFLVQVPPIHPAHATVSNFYQDFRSRLTALAFGEKKATPKSIEAVIAKQQKETAPKKTEQAKEHQAEATAAPQAQKAPRYIYSDGKGELHFADSLDDVPDEYRRLAQPMGE
jgi:hypothetical protein